MAGYAIDGLTRRWQKLGRFMLIGVLGIVLSGVVGCASDSPHRKTAGGMTMGAALGAIIGAAVGGEDGAALGALIGAAAGGLIGAQLDAEDQRKRQAAIGLAALQPPGSKTEWSSPGKGTSGQVARVGDVFTVSGRQCMQVEETITIKGKPATVTDTRCLDDDGAWVPQTT